MLKARQVKSTIMRWFRNKKVLTIAIAVCLIFITIGGMTIAWLTAESNTMDNTFAAASVTCAINETFDNEVKRDVCIQNTGTIDAYIRAALVPVWKDGGDIAGVSVLPTDYYIDFGTAYGTEWVHGSDGYYYCKLPISPSAFTPELINECKVLTVNGYQFELQIAAQAVQALPTSTVIDIWNPVTSVNLDGTLEVAP